MTNIWTSGGCLWSAPYLLSLHIPPLSLLCIPCVPWGISQITCAHFMSFWRPTLANLAHHRWKNKTEYLSVLSCPPPAVQWISFWLWCKALWKEWEDFHWPLEPVQPLALPGKRRGAVNSLFRLNLAELISFNLLSLWHLFGLTKLRFIDCQKRPRGLYLSSVVHSLQWCWVVRERI